MLNKERAQAHIIKHGRTAAVFAALFAVVLLLVSLPLKAETTQENYEKVANQLLGELLEKINKLAELKGLPAASLAVTEVMPKLIQGKYFIAKIDHPSVCQQLEFGATCPHYVVSMNAQEPKILIEDSVFSLSFVGMDKNGHPMFITDGPKGGVIAYIWRDGEYIAGEEKLP